MIYAVIIAVILIIVLFIYRESTGYNIVEYDLKTDKDIPSVRFVVLSDLHNTDVTHDGNKRLLDSIASCEPDFVIIAGDIITSYMEPYSDSAVAFKFLRELAAKHTVYYGLGNHEQRYRDEAHKFPGRYEKLVSYVKSLGIELLSDAYIDLPEKNIRVYGFDIPIKHYKRAFSDPLRKGILDDTFGPVDRTKLNILIAHTPDHFEEYARFGPDIVLSGHLHGGIIGIPGIGGLLSPQLVLFPKYDFGTYVIDDTTMIVTRGIGWHSIPIRIFNRAEIVSVTISKRGDDYGDQRKA